MVCIATRTPIDSSPMAPALLAGVAPGFRRCSIEGMMKPIIPAATAPVTCNGTQMLGTDIATANATIMFTAVLHARRRGMDGGEGSCASVPAKPKKGKEGRGNIKEGGAREKVVDSCVRACVRVRVRACACVRVRM